MKKSVQMFTLLQSAYTTLDLHQSEFQTTCLNSLPPLFSDWLPLSTIKFDQQVGGASALTIRTACLR